jgi:hypothetical protein
VTLKKAAIASRGHHSRSRVDRLHCRADKHRRHVRRIFPAALARAQQRRFERIAVHQNIRDGGHDFLLFFDGALKFLVRQP